MRVWPVRTGKGSAGPNQSRGNAKWSARYHLRPEKQDDGLSISDWFQTGQASKRNAESRGWGRSTTDNQSIRSSGHKQSIQLGRHSSLGAAKRAEIGFSDDAEHRAFADHPFG